MPGPGQGPIARQQGCIEHLRQRDIGSVIGSQISPQIPNAQQKKNRAATTAAEDPSRRREPGSPVGYRYRYLPHNTESLARPRRRTDEACEVSGGARRASLLWLWLPACAEGPRAELKHQRRSSAFGFNANRFGRDERWRCLRAAAQPRSQLVKRRPLHRLTKLAQRIAEKRHPGEHHTRFQQAMQRIPRLQLCTTVVTWRALKHALGLSMDLRSSWSGHAVGPGLNRRSDRLCVEPTEIALRIGIAHDEEPLVTGATYAFPGPSGISQAPVGNADRRLATAG